MEYQNIIARIDGKVGVVTLNRPKALNALNSELLSELISVLEEWDRGTDVRCIVLTGSERPLQARLGHRAAAADLLGLLDLYERGAGVADRKEQLGILVTAGSAVAPVHAVHSFFEREAMTPHVNGFTM